MSRRVKPNTEKRFYVYHPNTSLGWRIVRRVAFAEGEGNVSDGRWRQIFNDAGLHIGYQPIAESSRQSSTLVASRVDPTSLTARESNINAGTAFRGGHSRTAHLPERLRESRIHSLTGKVLPAEDAVERVTAKITAYENSANAGGDRAVRVYPKAVKPQPKRNA
jgi:hypothetical protein